MPITTGRIQPFLCRFFCGAAVPACPQRKGGLFWQRMLKTLNNSTLQGDDMRNESFTYQQDFFAEFPALRETFMKEARKYALGKKNLLFREGFSCNACYYLHSGTVRSYHIGENGKEALIAIYNSGDLLGLKELMYGLKHRSMAETMTQATIYTLEREKFIRLLSCSFDFTMKIMRFISKHGICLEERFASTMIYNVPERLIRILALYQSATSEIAPFPAGNPVDVRLSQSQLANMIGSTQCTVSKQLCRLQEGLLDIGIKHIVIPDPAVLWATKFRQPLEDVWL